MTGMRSLLSLWPYLRPHRGRIVMGLLYVLATSAAPSIVIWFLELAMNGMKPAVEIAMFYHSAGVVIPSAPVGWVYMLAEFMVATAVVGGIYQYGMREFLNGASRYVEYDLRNALFAHLEELDAEYYGRTRTGDIMARLTNDLSAVRMAAGPAIMYLGNTFARGIIAIAFMLRISPTLTGLSLLPMILLPAIMVRLGRVIHDRFEAVQSHFSTITSFAQENLSGTRIVRAYRQEPAELERFGTLNDEYLRRNMRLAYLYGGMNPGFQLLAGLGALTVLGFGGVLALRGTINLGEFVGFGLYLGILTWPLIALGWVINLFERGAASMGRLNDIFNARPALLEAEHPRALPPLAPGVGGRSIEFRRVGFHYPAADSNPIRWVLRDVSFTLPAGATLGVVGATGSGKTALVDLIPRIFDPQEGEVLIDGIPVHELPIAGLRREIGAVPQESLLFSDTIAANLEYGRLDGTARDAAGDATVPDVASRDTDDDGAAEIALGPTTGNEPDDPRWAARIAQLDETVGEFPGGYETMLGERGINLSGGQKQRAALARALARRPAIVILDDALSAVDTHTEAEILQGLRHALAGRTAVIASHRISAIRDATWIIVLDDGRVAEQGRHEELLARGGRYWALLRRQQLMDAIERDAA
jgi:ATP-binding cassette, subfamily B, multidrug efflux pump